MKINKELAEFVGALIGDGYIHLGKNKYTVGFTGSPMKDKEYYNHLRNIIKNIWNKDVKITTRARGLRIAINSKEIVMFLIEGLGLVYGKNKSETAFIPEKVAKNMNLVRYTIRGIADTDGSIFVSRKPGVLAYPSIEITTSSYRLATQLREILIQKGFRVAKIWSYKSKLSKRQTYKVPLNGLKNVKKWMSEIGFSNPYKQEIAKKIMGRVGVTPTVQEDRKL